MQSLEPLTQFVRNSRIWQLWLLVQSCTSEHPDVARRSPRRPFSLADSGLRFTARVRNEPRVVIPLLMALCHVITMDDSTYDGSSVRDSSTEIIRRLLLPVKPRRKRYFQKRGRYKQLRSASVPEKPSRRARQMSEHFAKEAPAGLYSPVARRRPACYRRADGVSACGPPRERRGSRCLLPPAAES